MSDARQPGRFSQKGGDGGDPEAIQAEMTRALSPAQKLAVVHELRRTTWELKAAWIRAREPLLSEDAVQARVREVFLRAAT